MGRKAGQAPDDLSDFYLARHDRLVGLLALYCGNHDVAEDLAHEALVRLCRDWRKVKRMDRPEAWLHRVGINLVNSHYRNRSSEEHARRRLAGTEPWVDRSDAEFLDALQDLPARQKAAVLLRHYMGLSTHEAAEVLGCPDGTIKTLVHKAIMSLRASGAMTGEQERNDVV